ncbi:cytochrome c biogenesis CcdA family protein [Natronorubrum thiooxidans]|uniref:Cytochrome c-type biogenesis protein n=1 Tax=Natronorubrum thiooxidans TaxID=308853 RepID=A0A1N7GKX3_9EURY|nr:cytochrome c biogenesis protein CcdA [Natronorubrum thiooxidans]SIS13148.1 cytochrome c-type biogenesis protein [Natronorubrum thiooxidans]
MTELLSIVLFALGAGVATFFSPCAYALLPGYVGYYVAATEDDRPPLSGIVARGTAATVGVLAVFAVGIGLVLSLGQSIEPIVPMLEAGIGVLLVGTGLFVLVRGSISIHTALPHRRSSVLGFALFGGAYAIAGTACVFPVFFALVVRSLSFSPAETALVLGSYASAFGILMLGVTTATAMGHRLATGQVAAHVNTFVRLAGVAIVAAGAGQLYVAFG